PRLPRRQQRLRPAGDGGADELHLRHGDDDHRLLHLSGDRPRALADRCGLRSPGGAPVHDVLGHGLLHHPARRTRRLRRRGYRRSRADEGRALLGAAGVGDVHRSVPLRAQSGTDPERHGVRHRLLGHHGDCRGLCGGLRARGLFPGRGRFPAQSDRPAMPRGDARRRHRVRDAGRRGAYSLQPHPAYAGRSRAGGDRGPACPGDAARRAGGACLPLPETVLDPVIVAWGYPLSLLELLAFALALACVVLEVLEIHWAWPLAFVSSLLYGWLFQIHRLYGEAGLQLFFAAMAIWGWTQWLYGRRGGAGPAADDPPGLRIARLPARRWPLLAAGWLAGWGLLGLGLARFTDTDVPWFDAFPTAGSVLGTLLMGRKLVEAW